MTVSVIDAFAENENPARLRRTGFARDIIPSLFRSYGACCRGGCRGLPIAELRCRVTFSSRVES